ncbi:virulence factor family protein (plasmid) [Mycetohabitans rhizoxinica]|uniref:virulence factor family protein n=1 Tax=Mycetohabitans rhizoxinica TaxID=412963 RepID=UPI0030D097D8
MKIRFLITVATRAIAACALALPDAHAAATSTLPGGRYGEVTLTRPDGPLRGFVVLFSDANGWGASDRDTAQALAREGALVVGVDTRRYAANLAAKPQSCQHLVSDAEALSHQLERQLDSSRYFAPIVAGTGQGATLARQILAQAPANTVAGALSLDPTPTLDARFQPCPPDPTVSRGTGLPGFFVTGTAAGKSQAERLRTWAAPYLRAPSTNDEDVSDLPLAELRAPKPSGMLAIVMSGDGGWRDLDKTIAENLQKDGVSVIGWDSLRYFWSHKTPEQAARDLARVLRVYGARWQARDVALIGYSFGADVMPFLYNRLPEPLRERVSYVSLLGFAPAADFQIRVTGWLGMPASADALPAKPEVVKLPASIVQCVYGEHETDTLCPALAGTGVDVVQMPGDHHFGRDYNTLTQRILAGWKKQIALRR